MKLFRSRTASVTLAVGPFRGHLFVLGAARTGTTILQNALNSSRDIFLLGEPDLHVDTGEPNFAARYNMMHHGWANQQTKSSFLPPLTAEDGAWPDHLAALVRHHRWTGSKVVVNASRPGDWLDRLYAFQCRYFFDARYLFTFRDPLAVARSTRSFQLVSGGEASAPEALLANYLEVMILFIRMIRTMPYVRAIFHEDVDERVFVSLAEWLDTSLDAAASYYDSSRVAAHSETGLSPVTAERMALVRDIYLDLRACTAAGLPRLQIEQNDKHLRTDHFTTLGMVDRRARMVLTAIQADQE